MSQPPGYVDPGKPNHVCHMKKSIYGLCQAPRALYEKFNSKLNDFRFTVSNSDPSLFTFHQGHITMYLLLYVDDIILTSNDTSAMQ